MKSTVIKRVHTGARELIDNKGSENKCANKANAGSQVCLTYRIALVLVMFGANSCTPDSDFSGISPAGDSTCESCGLEVSLAVHFVERANALGVVHSNPYGHTFDFTPLDLGTSIQRRLELLQRNMGNGAAVGDVDQDGDLDLYLLGQLGSDSVLLRNDLDRVPHRFTDVTERAGVVNRGLGRVATFADLNNDGWQDLLVLNDSDSSAVFPVSEIYRNNTDGTFASVTAGSGFAPTGAFKGGLTLADYDRDGLLDIFVTVWCAEAVAGQCALEGHNRLYRNLGDFRFDDVTLEVGLGIVALNCLTPVFADFDNDGDPDLYVAVDHSSDFYYRNDNGFFTDHTTAAGTTHTGNDMGLAIADFDDDGDLDIYSTNITDPAKRCGRTQYNTLQVNQLAETGENVFIDGALEHGVLDTAWGWGTEFVDVDNDGALDIFAVNGFDEFVEHRCPHIYRTPSVLFINNGNGRFNPAMNTGAEVSLDSRAAIAFDYDRDGDQDLLVTNVAGPTLLLDNDSGTSNHWLDVDLVGGGAVNTDAIGSRVYATVGGLTYMREFIAGGSYLSGRPHEAHFGLGQADIVDVLRVRWPDGTESSQRNVHVDQRMTIYHPEANPPVRERPAEQ